jgi:hypothetical protein
MDELRGAIELLPELLEVASLDRAIRTGERSTCVA